MDRLNQAAANDFPQNFVQKFLAHRVDDAAGTFMLKVRWIGWGPDHDTEEPIHTMVEDDPHRVEEYLRQHADEDVCARYLQEYFP